MTADSPALIGRELDLGLGADEVCRPLIRYWCEAFEDANPIHADEAFARSTPYGEVIAPSPFAASVSRRPFWPVQGGQIFGLIGAVGDELDCPESVVQRITFDFFLPLRLGDRVRCVERVIDVSPEKVTALGTGHFVTLERRYYNHRDELLSVATPAFLKFRRGSPRKPPVAPGVAAAQPAPAPRVTAARPARAPLSTLRWADVHEGDELPPVVVQLTVTRMVQMAYVSRDFNPVHHDLEYARANGAPHMFVQWACYAGLFGRFLAEWAGPLAWIQRISFHMQQMACAGDGIVISGMVAKVREEAGQRLAEITMKIATEKGTTTPGSAIVRLPS